MHPALGPSPGASRSVPGVFWTLTSIALLFTLLQFVGAMGIFGVPRAAAFAAGLWWLILSAATQFFVQAVATTRS